MKMLLVLTGSSQTTLLTGYMPVILIVDTSLRQFLLTESDITGAKWCYSCKNAIIPEKSFVLSGQLFTVISRRGKKCIFSLFRLVMQSVFISVYRKNIGMSLNEVFKNIFPKTCTETAVLLCSVLGFSRAWRWTTRKLQTSTAYQGPCQRNKIKWGLCAFHNINDVLSLLMI